MKEIRTIKMVEVTDVKFIADDGKEFVGDNAERDCRDYERTKDVERVKKAFNRLEATELNIPLVEWVNCDCGFWKILLNSKSDYVAMMDYFDVIRNIYDNNIKEPSEYPYTMTVYESYDYACEYDRDIKEDLQKALEQFN